MKEVDVPHSVRDIPYKDIPQAFDKLWNYCHELGSKEYLSKDELHMKDIEIEDLKTRAVPKDFIWPKDTSGQPLVLGDNYHVGCGDLKLLSVEFYEHDVCAHVEDANGKTAILEAANSSKVFDHITEKETDTWEKLEADNEKCACDYFYPDESNQPPCEKCFYDGEPGESCEVIRRRDMLRRAKALAGVDDE